MTLADGEAAGDTPGVVAGRWWYASEKAEQPWLLPVSADGGKAYLVSGLWGIEPAEREFMEEKTAGVFGGLGAAAQGDATGPTDEADDTCWLPARAQAELGVRIGERLFVMGFPLRVAGFFTPEQFGQWRQLTGDPMAPLEPGGRQVSAGQSGQTQNAALPESSYRFLDAAAVAVAVQSAHQVTQRQIGRTAHEH